MFKTSNNEAEYEALITGLNLAQKMGAKKLAAHSYSQLVVKHVCGDYTAREPNMKEFQDFSIVQIPRAQNTETDSLAKLAFLEGLSLVRYIYLEPMKLSSIEEPLSIYEHESNLTWMALIVDYLMYGTTPSKRSEARKLKMKVTKYPLINDIV